MYPFLGSDSWNLTVFISTASCHTYNSPGLRGYFSSILGPNHPISSYLRRWDMVMPSTQPSSGGTMASDSQILNLQDVDSLKRKVGPVRRNLFGPVDHQQLQQDFQQLLRMSVEVANKRWNFDFQRDVPGEGANVEWVELRCQDVPAFYRSCSVRGGVSARRIARSASLSSEEDSSPVSSSSSGSGDEYLEVTTRGSYPLQRLGKRRQSSITDFFKVKKRKLLHRKTSSRQ